MEIFSDTKVVIAIIAAATSFTVAMVTQFFKLLSDFSEIHRRHRASLMGIRNEIVVNQRLAHVIANHTRTIGIKFQDSVWSSSDTSVIYHKNIPSTDILDLYANIRAFNTLNNRSEAIQNDAEYKNKEKQLAVEHSEMIEIAHHIWKLTDKILEKLVT